MQEKLDMNSSSSKPHPTSNTRVPHSFFYDRVVPALFVLLGLVLLIVIALVIGALVGVIPIQ
jgi:hypothetical protein